jgi:hypothetical protein
VRWAGKWPARQQPFLSRLKRVLAIGAAAGERDRDVQQALAVFGEGPFQIRVIRVTPHAALPRTPTRDQLQPLRNYPQLKDPMAAALIGWPPRSRRPDESGMAKWVMR